jgi:hypothetical protein
MELCNAYGLLQVLSLMEQVSTQQEDKMYNFTTEANCNGIDVEMFFVAQDNTLYKEA